MTTINNTVDALMRIEERISENKAATKQLTVEKQELVKNIKSYLDQQGETGLRINESTYISVMNQQKKITQSKTDYEQKVRDLLYSRGIDDDVFTKELLNRTTEVVQHQKIKVHNKRK
jgi:predicted subunit of tRNA(5-methylaminomethyl-2-thiouridylate) methyltransferase